MARSQDGSAFRLLPSVEDVLRADSTAPLAARIGRDHLAVIVRDVLDDWRGEIRAGHLDGAALEERLAAGALDAALADRVAREERRGLVRAINATGVVLHTGLGRAPIHPEAAAAMERAARGYCVLEVDRETGGRSRRDDRVGELLARLTGAEAGIAVNNNAAATWLTLGTFAWGGREVVVSRGELVEIGGSFRMPDVMERASVRLREVGTTNRTRIGDFRAAVDGNTALLLKVHTSNYRVEGFTEEVSPGELAALGAELDVPSAYDLGSGLIDPDGARPIAARVGDEPGVAAAVSSGVDVVTFSGDKLLGGPQAGLVVGKRAAVEAMRANPVYRALRVDKVTLAGLERTLELLLGGRADELPTRRGLCAEASDLRPEAERLGAELGSIEGLTATVAADGSQPGSGSAPGVRIPTWVVRVRHARLSADALGAALRRSEPPVFTRIHEGDVVLDVRTLLPGETEELLGVFRALG